MIDFSIYIPAYNCEKTIKRAINSIISQTLDDWELIIINDGSTDNTAQALAEFSYNSRIKICSTKNNGVFCARLYAISLCKNSYVIGIDSDDVLSIDALAKIKKVIEKTNADIIHFSSANCYSNGRTTKRKYFNKTDCYYEKEQIGALIDNLVYREDYNTIWDKAIKRSLFDIKLLKKCKAVNIGEDNLIMLTAMINSSSYFYMRDVLYHYTCYGGITKAFRADSYTNLINRVFDKKIILSNYNLLNDNYSSLIEKFYLESIAKIMVYYPTTLTSSDSDDYERVFNQILNDKTFLQCYKKNKIGFKYRFPLFLLIHNKIGLLKFYKTIIFGLRRMLRW